MGRKISVLLLSAIVLLSSTAVMIGLFTGTASAEPSDDFDYEINDDNEVEITGYKGPGGNVVIPNTIEGKPVTSIGDNAFSSCTSLASVTIPDSVTSIGDYVFFSCASLTSIEVSSGNNNYASDNGMLYSKDFKTLIQCPGGKADKFTILDSVTTIGNGAFAYCTSLASITLPDSVTTIGDYAFSWCSALASATIGNSVTSVGNSAFNHCSSLASVTIGSGVGTIGDYAFYDCSALTMVFNGNAPTTGSDWASGSTNLIAYYYEGATGFETDSEGKWMGVPCLSIPPLSVEITSPTADEVLGTYDVTVTWTSDNAKKTEISTDGVNWDEVTGTSHPLSLTDGPHTVYVRVTGEVGNTKQASVSFTLDIPADVTAPTITDNSPTGDDVAINAKITVTFSEAMDHASVTMAIKGVTATIAWNGNTVTFTPSSALAYGTEYTVKVNGKDLAGNELAETSWTFTTLKDEGTIIGLIEDAYGSPVAGATVTLSNEMSTTTGTDGSFSFDKVPSGTYDLTIEKEGYVTLTVEVLAVVGKSSDVGVRVIQFIDVTDPVITITSPSSNAYLSSNGVTVIWTATDDRSGIAGYQYKLDDGEWSKNTTVTGRTFNGLSDGTHTVCIRAYDKAGNFAETFVEFTVDTVAPAIDAQGPTGDDESTTSAVNVTFSEAMNKTSVVIVIDGVAGTMTWNGNVATFTPSSVLKGSTEHTVIVNGKDLAGNALEETTWTFTTADVATVSGVIKDKDGNPVAGATVTLTSTSTSSHHGMVPVFSVQSTVGRTLTTITDADGRYFFHDVSIGEYTVAAEKDGKKYTESISVTAETIGSGTLTVDDVILPLNTGSDSTLLIVGIVAVIVIAVLAAVFLVRRKENLP